MIKTISLFNYLQILHVQPNPFQFLIFDLKEVSICTLWKSEGNLFHSRAPLKVTPYMPWL